MAGATAGSFGGEDILLQALEEGQPADFTHLPVPRTEVRAHVIRELLRGEVKVLDPAGVVLTGARVGGHLDLSGIEVPVGLFFRNCIFDGTINLCDAHIPSLALAGSKIVRLEADGLKVDKALFAERLICHGYIRMIGASIGDQANFIAAEITSLNDHALLADGIEVSGDLLLSGGFHARSRARSAVRLLGAHIHGDFDCDNSVITSSADFALNAEDIEVGGSVRLGTLRANEVPAHDHVRGGAVTLRRGQIGRELRLEGAHLNGGDRSALVADGLRVNGDLHLSGIQASGRDPDGVVRLRGTQVAGHFYCEEAVVHGSANPGLAIDLSFVRIGMALSLRGGFAAPEGLSKLRLDGMIYTAVPDGMGRPEWVRLLSTRMLAYAAQPYQQLAAVYRAAGQEDDARAVLIAQMDHLRRQARSRLTRIRLLFLKLTVGYGYQSWRALIGLTLTLAFAIAFVVLASHTTHSVRVVQQAQAGPGTSPRRCSLVDQIGLGVDLTIPLINTTTRQRCNLIASSPREGWLEAASWLFQVFGWSFATLFVVGYTGFIRKS